MMIPYLQVYSLVCMAPLDKLPDRLQICSHITILFLQAFYLTVRRNDLQ